jgi:MFS family permease
MPAEVRTDRAASRFVPLREREFRLLFIGRTVSMLGSAMAPVALAFAILDTLHGSPTDIGIVLACRQVPVVLLLLLGGVLGDRLPRNLVMVASNGLSGGSQAVAAVLLLTGRAQLWELAVLAAVNGASSAFFFPASAGVIPLTVTPALLQQANATLRLGLNTTTIAGAALGGLLVAATNPGIAILVDAVSYVAAAWALGLMRLPTGARAAPSSVLHDMRVGWGDFRSRGWLWAIVVQFGVVNAAESGAVNVLGPGVAKAHFGGAAGWGLVLTAQTAGLVVSGLLLLRWKPRRLLLTATFGAFGLVLLPLVLAHPLPFGGVVAGAFIAGVGLEIFGVLWQTAMQQEIPADKLSRLSSYDALGSWALIPIGSALAAPVASAVGTAPTFLGVAAIVVTATVLVLLSRDVRTLERRGAAHAGPPR